MIYLLDANVLIDANRDYYPIEKIPEFWEWLLYSAEKGLIKVPFEVFEELKNGNDGLATWAKNENTKVALVLQEDIDVELVRKVVEEGYANDLSDADVEKLGNDPFLIAYALYNQNERCVVTTEVSKPRKQGANKHVPNVCDSLDIQWCHSFELYRALDFSTNWRKRI